MKNLLLLILFVIIAGCTVPSQSQDKPREWVTKNLQLKDTLDGALSIDRLIVNDSAQVRYMRMVDSLSTEFLSIRGVGYINNDADELRIESFGNIWLNPSETGTINIADYGLLIDKSSGPGNEYIQTGYDLDLGGDVEIGGDLTVTGDLIVSTPAPIALSDLGGNTFEIDGSLGNIFYYHSGLTDHANITVTNIVSGQVVTVFIKGGMTMTFEPATINWTFHSSAGSEKWASGSPPSQTVEVDEYRFTRIAGVLYCRKVAEDYQ